MKKVKVVFSERAQGDLNYLADQIALISKSRELAKRYAAELVCHTINTLEFMPGMFAASEYESVRRFGKYAIQFKGYTIIYNIIDETVIVEHIMPSRMVIRGV